MSMIKIMMGKEEMFIRGEKSQWVIGKVGKDKNGEPTFTGEWFYTSLEGMFKNLLQRKVRCSDFSTFEELQRNIRKCTDELMGMYELDDFKEVK